MNKPIRSAYDLALDKIAAGAWRVDPHAGILYNFRGRPFSYKRADGYIQCKPDQHHMIPVHRVIWESVHGPICEGFEINHRNGIKDDNRIANLELVTHSENVKHAHRTGLIANPVVPGPRPRKTECDHGHGPDRWKLRSDGSRGECHECKRLDMARRRAA